MPGLTSLVLAAALASSSPVEHVPGAERRLTSPRPGAGGGSQWPVSLAANADEFTAVWQNRGRYYVSRMQAGGVVSDPTLLPVPGPPQVAYAGGSVVLTWIEGQTLFGAALRDDGTIADPISLGEVGQLTFVLLMISNGNDALVLVHDAGENVRARILGADARPVSEWVLFPGSTYGRYPVAAAADATGFAIASLVEDRRAEFLQQVQWHRITREGVAAALTIETTAQPVDGVGLAWDGTNYLLALRNDYWSPTPRGTEALLVSVDGRAVSERFRVTGETEPLQRVIGRPGGSLVLLEGGGAVTVDHATRSVSSVVHLAPTWPVHAATNGDIALLAWSADQDVYGRWIDVRTAAPVLEPFVISTGTRDQFQPAVALGSDVDMAVWEEIDDDGVHSVFGAQLDRAGNVMDAEPHLLSTAGVNSLSPAVAFDGQHFVVVWAEQPDLLRREGRLLARRVRQDGSLVDRDPIVISDTWAGTPAIAHADGTTLVVWTGYGSRTSTHGPGLEVFGARLAASGLVDSTPLFISRDPWDHYVPDIVAGHGAFLVGWQTYFWYGHHSPVYTASSVALVTTGGTVHEPVVLESMAAGANATAPQLAWNGDEFLAAWQAWGGVSAITLSQGGELSFRRKTIPLPSLGEAAYVDGSWHLISGRTATFDAAVRRNDDISGVFLSPELNVQLQTPIAPTSDDESEPAIASDGTRAIVVYRREVSAPPHNGAAVVAYRLYDDPNVCCEPQTKRRRRAVR